MPYYGWVRYPYYGSGYPYYSTTYVTPTYTTGVDSTAVSVQQALADAGYYDGAIDGIVGPNTSGAIAAYQRDNGLPVTGSINASLLQSLGIS